MWGLYWRCKAKTAPKKGFTEHPTAWDGKKARITSDDCRGSRSTTGKPVEHACMHERTAGIGSGWAFSTPGSHKSCDFESRETRLGSFNPADNLPLLLLFFFVVPFFSSFCTVSSPIHLPSVLFLLN